MRFCSPKTNHKNIEILVFQDVALLLLVLASKRSPFCYRTFDCAVEEWRQFHCDMNDLSQWLTDSERLMSESVGPEGQLDLNSARQHQEVSVR